MSGGLHVITLHRGCFFVVWFLHMSNLLLTSLLDFHNTALIDSSYLQA
jgi:hypothetical protein